MLRPAPGRLSSARPYTSSFARQQGKAVAQALTDSFLHEARPCKPCRKRKTAQGKASWPAGHLRASHRPGPPHLSSPLYKQLRKTVVPQLACAGQSFVARGPPVCFGHSPGPPQLSSPLYKQLRKTAGQSCRTSTNGQFLARSSPLQAVSQEKDSAGQSFVARGPPACFAQPRAASAKLAPIQASSRKLRGPR